MEEEAVVGGCKTIWIRLYAIHLSALFIALPLLSVLQYSQSLLFMQAHFLRLKPEIFMDRAAHQCLLGEHEWGNLCIQYITYYMYYLPYACSYCDEILPSKVNLENRFPLSLVSFHDLITLNMSFSSSAHLG